MKINKINLKIINLNKIKFMNQNKIKQIIKNKNKFKWNIKKIQKNLINKI